MKKVMLFSLIGVILLVLFFGLQPAMVSNELSKNVTRIALENKVIVDEKANEGDDINLSISRLNVRVRTKAHEILYMVVAFALIMGFYTHSKNTSALAYGALLALTIAIIDETIQGFVPGRGAQVIDVIVDAIGIAKAILLALAVMIVHKLVTKLRGRYE